MALERSVGTAAVIGGLLGVLVAPVMVMIKYLSGWSVVPEPWWVAAATQALGPLLTFAAPPVLWMVYGGVHTAALLLMLAGLIVLALRTARHAGILRPAGLWIVIAGLVMVIVGDAVHSATWHQNGLRVPTPGTNPVANTAYAIHMMGMNFVMAGALVTGIGALRSGLLPSWLAWAFLLVFPSAVVVSLTLLPTTPAGGLWMFSMVMVALGRSLRSAARPGDSPPAGA